MSAYIKKNVTFEELSKPIPLGERKTYKPYKPYQPPKPTVFKAPPQCTLMQNFDIYCDEQQEILFGKDLAIFKEIAKQARLALLDLTTPKAPDKKRNPISKNVGALLFAFTDTQPKSLLRVVVPTNQQNTNHSGGYSRAS